MLNSQRSMMLNTVFFGSWLVLSLILLYRKDNYLANRFTLLSGGLLSLLLPLISGFYAGNRPWRTFSGQNYDVFAMDMLWFITGLVCLFAVRQTDAGKRSAA